MNLFGVLKYKKMGEDFVRNSGLPYTIIRSVARNLIAINFIINSKNLRRWFNSVIYACYILTSCYIFAILDLVG